MAKKIKAQIKLQIPAGKANPAPPVGPALGQHGLNIAEFCQKYNAATQSMAGDVIPVIINVYEDRTYDFILKSPPASQLILKAAGIPKGSQKPLTDKIGKVTRAQLLEIAEKKKNDLNTTNMEQAAKMIEGTARQMGIEITD